MDLPDVAPDAVIYLPVNAPGALLYLGDRHPIQGDGELRGVALGTSDRDDGAGRPHQELDNRLAAPGDGGRHHDDRLRPSVEDAARIAYRELIRCMAKDYGYDELDAYMLLTQCGRVRLGNMVDSKYTLGASILKSISL